MEEVLNLSSDRILNKRIREPRHFARVFSNSLLLHLTIHDACINLASMFNKNSPLLDPIKFSLHVCFLLSFTRITSGYEGVQ